MERKRGPLVVSGVVHHSGVLGSRPADEDDWALTFALQPWRILGGPLHLGRLSMRWWMPQNEAHAIARRLDVHFVVALRVSALDEAHGAEVVGFHQLDQPDLELVRWATALREQASHDRRNPLPRPKRAGHAAPLVQQAEQMATSMSDLIIAHVWR
jgi:hypothetical protein